MKRLMENNKSLYLTIGISLFLFSFVTLLLYIIYCYAYYDRNEEQTYANLVNRRDYDFIYENLVNEANLSKEEFNLSYNLLFDKNTLKNIYYTYYKDSDIFETLEDFITYYYYGNTLVNKEDITFATFGKTNLFKRRTIKYESINLTNSKDQTASLGLKQNITLKIENNDILELDGQILTCQSRNCFIDTIFGGLHTIKYTSNNYDYFSILPISEENEIIDISSLNTLVKIAENKVIIEEPPESIIKNALIQTGTYKINKCYLESGCANKRKSYLILNEDQTITYYTYTPFEEAGDEYIGTYEIQGNFLKSTFQSHTYSVFDYDTKQTTHIKANVNTEMRFKITDSQTLTSDSYEFKWSAE